ncbi:hypothetical protein F511_39154 [Dorcoceras hygrometricum]|uniref:Plant bHLH transcription factor ACT-like domain-containing protein n=1 Tax=Dorcoceras hygrometricum TaxID=472368 RepID=A0A2Z7AG46_9LAMI|nr:hypothetical protein F511_39154 [Dorcoceras hygrometricum]
MGNSKKMARRRALRRKLHVLKNLTNSKSARKSGIIMDAFLYIYQLKLRVEAIKREYQHLVSQIQDVKVEKVGAGFFSVRVTCKKSEEILGSILEAFEGMKVNVIQARVACKHFFTMEAIVEASAGTDETMVNEGVLQAVRSDWK